MTDQRTETGAALLPPEQPKPNSFSLDVQIGGLPFVFKGTLPEQPTSFEWKIHLPDWGNIIQNVNPNHKGFPEYFRFKEKQGEIVSLHIDPPGSKIVDLYISKVKSNTWLVPEGTPYHEARGVGSFLMNNLLALADVKGWSVTAFPYTDGRLTDDDVREWLLRKGFAYDIKAGELIRKPAQPDYNQPVIQLLTPQKK